MDFKRIKISGWQQFEEIDINFHNRLTIITGANGSGKTTILNILARHFGWEAQSLATPRRDKISRVWKWFSGLFSDDDVKEDFIGEIEYSNGMVASLTVPQQNCAQYSVQIKDRQNVDCFIIPSHRSVFRYQLLTSIPTTQESMVKRNAFDKVSKTNKNRYFGGHEQYSSSFYIKETLISWNVFGKGNDDMEPNDKLLEYYNGFEKILKIILPKEIGFNKFKIINFELVLQCDSGDFIIDASSGGISAIIDMAWQIYMYSTEKGDSFTVFIDEIENHLHPTMQRRILSDFVEAFPNVSFIVSTHSPLIVSSVRESEVYVLRFNERKKVITQNLDLINKAKNATEILDEVLGVSFTMPVWAEEELNKIVSKYAKEDVSEKIFLDMRRELAEVGLEKLMPESIINLIKEKDDKNK